MKQISNGSIIAFWVAATVTQLNAQCLLPISSELLIETTVGNQVAYALPKDYVDQLKNNPSNCIDRQAIESTQAMNSELVAAVENYQALTDDLNDQIVLYQTNNSALLETLNRSNALTLKYDTLLTDYDELAVNYAGLVKDYDALAGTYREIAKNLNTGFSLDGGVGFNDGSVSGLIGVGYKRIKVWGTLSDGQAQTFVGVSVPF